MSDETGNKLLTTGIVGTVVAALCCFTPILAILLGAVGLSAGLTYTPGMYADGAELAALCAAVGERGGFFSPHHRSYGAGALEAYAEMVDVAERSGCALHLAHATLNFGPNKGRAGELITLLDAAVARGVDLPRRGRRPG